MYRNCEILTNSKIKIDFFRVELDPFVHENRMQNSVMIWIRPAGLFKSFVCPRSNRVVGCSHCITVGSFPFRDQQFIPWFRRGVGVGVGVGARTMDGFTLYT